MNSHTHSHKPDKILSLVISGSHNYKLCAGADPGKMKGGGGLVERGEAPYEGMGTGGGARRGEIFCFLQFAHNLIFEISY